MTSATHAPPVERVYPPKVMFVVVNPLMTWLLGTGAGRKIDGLARLEFRGRRSGNEYKIAVALHKLDGELLVLTNSRWRWNFEDGHPVTAVIKGERRAMVGTLETDPDQVARIYARRIDEMGFVDSARRLGIRINVDRKPTHDELAELAKRVGLSAIDLKDR